MLAFLCATAANAGTVNVEVAASDAGSVVGVRWILEEDATWDIDPYNPPAVLFDSAAYQLHKSYMPVAMNGESATSTFTITGVDESKRYYLSVLPNLATSECGSGGGGDCYTMSGGPVRFNGSATANVLVTVTPQALPTAQARVRVFDDRGKINNWPDPGEAGLGDFAIFIYDIGGGPLVTDTHGNPLGTRYLANGDIDQLGDGTYHTMNEDEVGCTEIGPGCPVVTNPLGLDVGEVQIQNIAPGKYGLQAVPPPGQTWQQTTTIEGTKGIDVWLRAGEPTFAVEFGPTLTQAFFGMVTEFSTLDGTHTISGTATNLRMQRPPNGEFISGDELGSCWIGLNDSTGIGRYAAPCPDGDAHWSIPNVPDGTYNVVTWDTYLLNIIGFHTAVVAGGDVDLGEVPQPRWFANHEHYVYNDLNGNGIRDAGEPGLPEQAINLRYRDGSIYAASATDLDGYLPLEEVFPFFAWLVAEVDFARFAATGVRITVDESGAIPVTGDPDDPLDPANGLRTPQIQAGGGMQRVETIDTCAAVIATGVDPLDCEDAGGPPLTEGYNAFAGNNMKFEWGKRLYGPGENGGISGVVIYQTTRAENDPAFAAGEPWEPGIPRVPVMLYRSDPYGVIQDTNGVPGIQLADVDYYPFDWSEGGAMGAEDVERSGTGGVYDIGDAIEAASTDSWDDNIPTGCVNDTLMNTDADPSNDDRCYDALRNWNQVRPAVFDGGYGLGAPWSDLVLTSGSYVVEAVAPTGYEHQDELSKNVDFGDTFATQALPPVCVGDPDHTGGQQDWNYVPQGADLELFAGVPVDSRFEGNRTNCNFKQVLVTDSKNTAADFFLYTEVPVTGHIHGNVLNDIGNATRLDDPNFGEKIAASFIPISIRDYAGNEVNRLYTDKDGRYNGLVPSTYTINAPMPTGVSPNMVRVCLNPPTMQDPTDPSKQIPDPWHDSRISQNCYTFNFGVAQTTYLDTPVLPVAAFVDSPDWQLDCNFPDGTPVISYANNDSGSIDGPLVDSDVDSTITLYSAGTVTVADPTSPRPASISRDYGFGAEQGKVFLDGKNLAIVNWAADGSEITVTIKKNTPTGQLVVERKQDKVRSVHGITVTSMTEPGDAHIVAGAGAIDDAIQTAIDAASPGDVVMVPPGTYTETVIITKPIQLQGYGAGVTLINAGRAANQALLISWREEANRRVNCPEDPDDQIGLLPGQRNNVAGSTDPANCGFRPATGLFAAEERAGVLVAPAPGGPGAFGSDAARIDGFTVTSSDYAGGIIVNGYATGLEISNNILRNNQGLSSGGIRIGQANLYDENGAVVDAENDNINIHHNYVTQNSSTFDNGGGLGLYNGSDNYNVSSNYVCGNFSQGDGAGIAHYGRSPGGVIQDNQILFNQSYDQTAKKRGGNGGGIHVSGTVQGPGAAISLTAGSGSVKIIGNNIHGNQAGTGDGGAIALTSINGQDLLVTVPANRDSVEILNNMITNNMAGYAGAIGLEDAVNVSIIHNTIVNNDSTAMVAAAFGPDPNFTLPQPAGVVSRAHSDELLALGAAEVGTFSDPTLANNIILGNRQMHWESGTGLVNDGFWDLAVLGTALPESLSPSGNILTSEDALNAAYSADNTLTSVADEDDLMLTPYVNGPSGTAAAYSAANFATVPLAATAQDEGGNFITALFGPLSPVGDYHLENNSDAADAAPIENMVGIPDLFMDIDAESRPVYGSAALLPDYGADELRSKDPGSDVAPVIISMPPMSVQEGVLYEYQVIAVDANKNTTFTYSSTGGDSSGIDGDGLFTWTPSDTTTRSFSVTATDETSLFDTQTFTLNPYTPVAPTANDDPDAGSIEVNVMGQFIWSAPGVLANDLTGNPGESEVLTPTLVGGSPAAALGSLALGADGAVIFSPADTWVGDTSFMYNVSDGSLSDGPATVDLRRRVAITNATFTDSPGTASDEWSVSGTALFGGGGTKTIFVDLVSATAGIAPITLGDTTVGTGSVFSWNINNDTGIPMGAGDTLTVRFATGPALLKSVIPSVLYSGAGATTSTTVFVQCPGDVGDDFGGPPDGIYSATEQLATPEIWCKHIAAGDGFIRMADDSEMYIFGFSDVSDELPTNVVAKGLLNAQFPAPTLEFNEGQQAWLTLTNVGTIMRPDLFDPHTVHFHGFPNASAMFDGVPESSVSINGGFSLTYYYNILEPGTFMYHCHVEASEHMQMGMLGNLYVNPAQNGTTVGGFDTFVYNDGDGSTGYDVVVPLQIGSMDSNYHSEHLLVQPLPFAGMFDDYPGLNGRGYPDTISAADIPPLPGGDKVGSGVQSAAESSQKVDSIIDVTAGDRILLRISNLNVTQFNTLATSGLTMKVVGQGAHILRGPGDDDLYYETNSVTLGGGEAVDVLIETAGVTPGTYILYTTNLYNLSNGAEDFGGLMTEIVIH